MELQFLIIFEVWALVFEARAVILKAWGPMSTFSGMVLRFHRKKCVRRPPQGVHGPTFCGLAKRFFCSSVFVSAIL